MSNAADGYKDCRDIEAATGDTCVELIDFRFLIHRPDER